MRSSIFLIAFLLPITLVQAEPSSSGLAKSGWEDFIGGGCRISEVKDPITAKALRNTPSAIRGRDFEKIPDLDAYFRADGSWYKHDRDRPELSDAEQQCVRKLAVRESELRKIFAIPREFEGLLLRHHDLVVEQFRPVAVGDSAAGICAWSEELTVKQGEDGAWSLGWSKTTTEAKPGSKKVLEWTNGCSTTCKADGACEGKRF